jgi:Na+-transporting NADH:ubiquinone oxidoreductase subunit NqrB
MRPRGIRVSMGSVNATRSDVSSPKGSGTGFVLALLPCFTIGVLAAGLGAAPTARLISADLLNAVVPGLQQVLPALLVCVGTAVAVAHAFARFLDRPRIPAAATAACLFVLTLPPNTPLIPAAVSMLFGWALGREVFGSAERSFVHPAVLAHVFLALAWPHALTGTPVGGAGAASVAACLIGAIWVLGARQAAWRVAVAVPLGAAIAALAPATQGTAPGISLLDHFMVGNLSLGALFLAGQPLSSPTTTSAQWFHGALVGALVILFRLTGPSSPDATMSAILIGSVFAPLADEVVRYGQRRARG